MAGFKKIVSDLLEATDHDSAMRDLLSLPARRVINPLIGFLCRKGDPRRDFAVDAIGLVTARLAKSDIESARVIMRRLMWSLNDESGGIGWGAPEAMGEIMARNEGLADEYHNILFSYVNPEGKNYLEHDALRVDALRGIERLARFRPDLVARYSDHLVPFFSSPDDAERKAALRAAELAGIETGTA